MHFRTPFVVAAAVLVADQQVNANSRDQLLTDLYALSSLVSQAAESEQLLDALE